MAFFDIWEQTVVTELIRREHEQLRRTGGTEGGEIWQDFGANILPIKAVNGRHIKIRVQDIVPVGLAQFKAPGATPALWTTKPRLKEQVVEIVDIDEFHRVDPIDMLKLKSPDPNYAKEALLDLTQRGAGLQTRNEQRTEWMRWEALKGSLQVSYPDAGSIVIDYGIPNGNFTTFGTQWTDTVNADPVEDLWALASIAVPVAGVYLQKFHLTSDLYRYIRRNQKIQDMLSSYGRSNLLPTQADIRDMLREGSEFVLFDGGYIPENNTDYTVTRWLPANKILATPSNYTYGGHPIGDMADGWVLVGPAGGAGDQPVARQGMQSEWIYNRIGQQTLLRQASARLPRLYAPEAIAWATAHA